MHRKKSDRRQKHTKIPTKLFCAAVVLMRPFADKALKGNVMTSFSPCVCVDANGNLNEMKKKSERMKPCMSLKIEGQEDEAKRGGGGKTFELLRSFERTVNTTSSQRWPSPLRYCK